MIGIKKGDKVTVALSLSPFMYMGSNDLIEDNIPYFKADYDCYVFAKVRRLHKFW